ncbi:MAG: MFS transporter [Spirochaetes bacterium]|nr:MFS transporter [Spirochaetota bacterium]
MRARRLSAAPMNPIAPPGVLKRSLRLVTVAGSLALVYSAAISSPMSTDFFRRMGFGEVEFGILSGIPMLMLGMQFLGALWGNRLQSRRAVFMGLIISGRLLWIPIILVPLLPVATGHRTAIMLALLAVSSLLLNLGPPIWFSWMGDLIPRRILSRYWGGRMRMMQGVWLLTYIPLVLFGFRYQALGLSLPQAFFLITVLGVAAGVVDILLFLWVWEPPPAPARERPLLETLLEPMRQPSFRSYMVWNVAYSASVMIGAAFMLLYVLKVLALPLWEVMVIWWMPGIGSMLSSAFWGRLIDRFGSRPILVLCTGLKPLAPIVFFVITRENAFAILCGFFIFDNMLNMGSQLATNGFMLRMAPRENRGMFVAAISSLPGIAGGLSAIAGGYLLKAWEGHGIHLLGRAWDHYQYLFLLSALLRLLCIPLALRIREPESAHTMDVLSAMVEDWPSRLVSLPVALFRRIRGG